MDKRVIISEERCDKDDKERTFFKKKSMNFFEFTDRVVDINFINRRIVKQKGGTINIIRLTE